MTSAIARIDKIKTRSPSKRRVSSRVMKATWAQQRDAVS
jgi:hypothetical protein